MADLAIPRGPSPQELFAILQTSRPQAVGAQKYSSIVAGTVNLPSQTTRSDIVSALLFAYHQRFEP